MASVIKKYKYPVLIIICVILVSNLTLLKELGGINYDYYRYSNYGGTVAVHEIFSQGRIIDKKAIDTLWKTAAFKRTYPESVDTVLFRNFKIQPLKFWRWGEYVFNWRFRLPYINWKEVRQR